MKWEQVSNSGGVQTSLAIDEATGLLVVKDTADYTGLLDHNSRVRSEGAHRTNNLRHVANVPLDMLFRLKALWKSQGLDEKKEMKRFLNDPDFRGFRVDDSRV